MHIVTLLNQSPHGAAHRHHRVIGMRAEHQHTLGVGDGSLGTMGVIGIGLAARPTCDGVLHHVEDLDVDIVGRTEDDHQLAQAIVIIVLVGKLENGLAGLVAQPHDGTADEVVGPLARRHLPRVVDARESRGGL